METISFFRLRLKSSTEDSTEISECVVRATQFEIKDNGSLVLFGSESPSLPCMAFQKDAWLGIWKCSKTGIATDIHFGAQVESARKEQAEETQINIENERQGEETTEKTVEWIGSEKSEEGGLDDLENPIELESILLEELASVVHDEEVMTIHEIVSNNALSLSDKIVSVLKIEQYLSLDHLSGTLKVSAEKVQKEVLKLVKTGKLEINKVVVEDAQKALDYFFALPVNQALLGQKSVSPNHLLDEILSSPFASSALDLIQLMVWKMKKGKAKEEKKEEKNLGTSLFD